MGVISRVNLLVYKTTYGTGDINFISCLLPKKIANNLGLKAEGKISAAGRKKQVLSVLSFRGFSFWHIFLECIGSYVRDVSTSVLP